MGRHPHRRLSALNPEELFLCVKIKSVMGEAQKMSLIPRKVLKARIETKEMQYL